jgi:cellulose synthase/poly-beta-1,6-N-acetylglucosamine synthase-like glycosyltransferase
MIASLQTGIILIFWFSVIELAYSYLIYPVLLWFLAWRFGRTSKCIQDYEPTVAIVIAVYNEEKIIAEKLRSIFAVDYNKEKLSIWIGSDCSTDLTDEIVRNFGDPRIHLWVAPDRSGKAGVLNRLIPQVEAEILLLTDADIMFEKDCVQELTKHFADPEVGGVGGLTIHRFTNETAMDEESIYRRFESRQKFWESQLHSTISAFGPFYAIRKSLFVPFHPHTYSNDDVLMPMNIIRQGYRMYFDSNAVSYEEHNESVGIEFNRRIRIGAGNFQAFFWLLDFLNPLKGWPWFCYVSHKVTRWFSPLFFLSAVLACGFLARFDDMVIYKMMFYTGCIFAISSLFYQRIPLPIMRHIFYFLAMNVALGLGFFKFLRGIRTAAWMRTER